MNVLKFFIVRVYKFFTLKYYVGKGRSHHCSVKERIRWVQQGCPLRDKEVVDRAVKMAQTNRAS